MATAVASSARSLYGCWTCRVRKKKCDENRPACSVCVSLKLTCYGYGDRPVWMENGPLQREQALKVKRILSQNNSKQRKQRMLRTSSSLPYLHEETPSASVAPSNYPWEEAPSNGSVWSKEIVGDGVEFQTWNMDLNFFDTDYSGASSQDNSFTTEWSSNNRSWENDMCVDNGLSSGHDSMPSSASGGSQDSEATLTRTLNTSTVQKDSGQSACGMSQKEMHQGAMSASAAESSWSSHPTHAPSLSANKVVKEYPMFPTYPRQSVLRGKIEDELFMHYLDEVFYIQYPFYNSPYKQSRTWLFSTLRRARSVYHATLALSERHMQSMIESSLLPTLSNKPNYHSMALREMELSIGEFGSLNGTASLVRSVEGIVCILQILFFELFAGGTGNWRDHLLIAAPLILPLVQARMNSIGQGSTGLDYGTQQPQERGRDLEDDTETKVLIGSFIWFDIIACASTRSQPSLDLDYKHILETFGISLGSLFGCANRVMALIFEIVLLDNWRRDTQKTRQLSMVELVKRGAEIEERLRQETRDAHSLGSNLLEISGSTLSASQAEITNIFALSALTYLHVVVSGAYPELPEIAESVSKSIAAFKGLTDPRLLRNLIWPFCVSGCLALEGQQSFFRDLVSKAEIAPSTFGTCLQAFRIIEECWEMRKSCSYNCDWVFIMNKLGCNVLLI